MKIGFILNQNKNLFSKILRHTRTKFAVVNYDTVYNSCSLFMTVIRNYHKLDRIIQCKLIFLHFWKSEVQNQFHQDEIKIKTGPCSLRKHQKKICFLTFSISRVVFLDFCTFSTSSKSVAKLLSSTVSDKYFFYQDACDGIQAHLDKPEQSSYLRILNLISLAKFFFVIEGNIHRFHGLGYTYSGGVYLSA